MDYFHITQDKQDLLAMSSLGLAYLGDAVYEVMVPGPPWPMWPPPGRRR